MTSSLKVSAPVSQGRIRRSAVPAISRLPNGDCRIVHREYIADHGATTVAFSAIQYPINPGLPQTFPWLSGVANLYESYKLNKLVFDYETESSTSTTGSIMMAVDYDASDAAPASKVQLMSYRSAVRSPVWSNCKFTSAMEDLQKQKSHYVRNGDLSPNQDVKLYDVGNYWACSFGASGATLGELYVEYDVTLMTPQLDPTASILSSLFSGESNAAPFETKTGNFPATVSSTGTTTSVSTFTFSQTVQGIAVLSLVGTGITAITWSGAGSEAEITELIDAGAENAISVARFSEVVPSTNTLVITIANSSLSSAQLRLGEYLYSLA